MRNRIERLRLWLAGGSIFLLLVIAGFIGYARLLRHLHHLKVPRNLGVDVVRDANGITFSHSVGGKTLYTLHAANQTGYKNGKVSLHGVSVVLYGQDGTRRDRISGDDFEYDQNAGVLRAIGLVHIDLQQAPPNGTAESANPSNANQEPTGPKVFHVLTSNLVYLDKLGVAATSDYIEFQAGGMKGHATGADYSSDTGMLMLHSAVSMSGVSAGQPVSVTAATAQFDDRNREALLTRPKYESAGRTAQAQQATVHARPDGTVSRIDAQGNVTMQGNGGSIVGQRADLLMNQEGRPQSTMLTGGVQYTSDGSLRQMRGSAQQATIAFDADGKPQHAVFTNAVNMVERVRATPAAREPWSTKDLTASKVDVGLVNADGRTDVRDAEATGGAHLHLVKNAKTGGPDQTDLAADDLKAHFLGGSEGGQLRLDTIAGRGHTVLRQVSANGVEQTSSGDNLDAKFRPERSRVNGAGPTGQPMADALASAVQQGHVTMTRLARGKGQDSRSAASEQQRATADRAAYDGAADSVTLTGKVQLAEGGSTVWANEVQMDRATGDVRASGPVKVDYAQTNRTAEPMHIVADRAEMERATEVATFYGKPVRLWQAGSQVLAPEVEIARAQQRLIARGSGATGWLGASQAAQVHTVLSSGGAQESGQAPAGSNTTACGTGKRPAGSKRTGAAGTVAASPNVVRIASGGLVYSGILRQAEFTGGVRADTSDATIRANAATAYLVPGEKTKRTGAVPSLAGSLERVVATGSVDVLRPGLKASGGRLTYTAADQVLLLSGTADMPARAVGAQGTTTGAALRFNSCDDSVEALNQVQGGPPERVRTQTRVNSDRKKEKGRQ